MKIVIIGAVAAGTSAAAKARRNSETASIKIFELEQEISYSACGIPYYIGAEIEHREELVPRDVAFFKQKYQVEILTKHQVLEIKPLEQRLLVKNLLTGESFFEPYDKLIIATGATPHLPAIKGIEKQNLFTLRNIISADMIKDYLEKYQPQKALIVGSGFIGLEMAENLKELGLEVTLVEAADHLMKAIDPDVAKYLAEILQQNGVEVYLNETVVEFRGVELVRQAVLQSGKIIETDLVIWATGVRPRVELAQAAGIELGVTGAIKINQRMETNLPEIYACGDCAESYSLITGKPVYQPLGSTANKTGRIAGDQVTGGDLEFRGILGTGILRIFETTLARTGLTEQEARAAGYEVAVCHNIKLDKPEYFHGTEMLIKAIADRQSGRLLGVQIIGKAGVDKRIDVFITAITLGAQVQDLFHLDLAYAPPYSTTKDPVMYTGMILTNELERGRRLITPDELGEKFANHEALTVIDARANQQYQAAHIEGAINLPPEALRAQLNELDPEQPTVTYCNKGVTGNAAQNILINHGFKEVYNLSGGHKNYSKTKK